MLGEEFKSKASLREALPLKDTLRSMHRSAIGTGEGAVLKHLVLGLAIQKGSGAYTSADNLNCPNIRLFQKMLSQFPGLVPSG